MEGVNEAHVRTLRRQGALPVWAVDGLLGAALLGRPSLARAALGALDRAEARAAQERSVRAIQLAAELGAPYVLLGLGPVAGVQDRWDRIRRRFLRGELWLDRTPAERLMAERLALAQRQLPECRRSLDALLGNADRHGVGLLLPNPRRALDLPGPAEVEALLQDFSGAPLKPLLDLPAAHLTSSMRMVPLRETIAVFARGPLCCLGDACGAIGALPPGRGEVDVAAVARHLQPEVRRAFVPWTGLRMDEVKAGCEGVRDLPYSVT